MEDDDGFTGELIACLNSKNAVLLAGAGSSVPVGYPTWPGLIGQLADKFASKLDRNSGESEADFATRVVETIIHENRLNDYHIFLERTFEVPPGRLPYEEFHLLLVRFGFCGLVTTNYDEVIENAVRQAYYTGGTGPYHCEALDLCEERSYMVFEFLRSLANAKDHNSVLHLHGHYRQPAKLILTSRDYQTKYGETPSFADDGRPLNKSLNTLHRKVLWTLATTHPIVFVGFSMSDPFFTHILQVISEDFFLGSEGVHFAIMPYKSHDNKKMIEANLQRYNTKPIFYPVQVDEMGNENHQALPRLISDLSTKIGLSGIINDDLDKLNKRMWTL